MTRYRFDFWLDGSKDDELLVAEKVDELKRKRRFASVVRDGIMIISELREGKIDLLLKLYPWIAEKIIASAPPPQTTPSTGDIERQIADLRKLIMDQGGIAAPPANYPMMKSSGSLAAGKVIAAPVFDHDDDEDTLVITKAAPQRDMMAGLFDIINSGLQGKNHTAEANAKSLAGRRQ